MSDAPPLRRGEDRRKSARKEAQLRARILSPKPGSGMLLDISTTGLLIEVARPPLIPEGTPVQLQFKLPGSKKDLKTHGEVVRHAGTTMMGIRFTRLDADDHAAISAFIDK